MTTEKWWNNKLIIFLTIMSLVTTILLVRVLIMLYNTKIFSTSFHTILNFW